jgi:hypothetical protein
MTHYEKCMLVKIHAALDEALGDSDGGGQITDRELREDDPVLWAAQKIAGLIGPGPWDKYLPRPASEVKE